MKNFLLATIALLFGNLLIAQQLQPLGSDLTTSNSGTQFGNAISLNDDGTIAAIGSPAADLVQVFEWNITTEVWEQLGADISGESSGDNFGHDLEISANGEILAISAPYNDSPFGVNAGHVRVYEWDGSNWVQKGTDIDGLSDNYEIGTSVALSKDGSTVVIGAPNWGSNGYVAIYEWNGSDWVPKPGTALQGESSNDQFGSTVSANEDGDIIAGGARLNDGNGTSAGHVRVYEWDGSAWVQMGADIDGEAGGDDSGISADLSADGLTVAIGARRNDGGGNINGGHVRVYEWNGSSWQQKGSDINGDFEEERMGTAVAIDDAGEVLVVGSNVSDTDDTDPATDRGEAKVFVWDASQSEWIQTGEDLDGKEANANFGHDVAISGDGSIAMISAGSHANGEYAQAFYTQKTSINYEINYPENSTDVVIDLDVENASGMADQGITYSITGGEDQSVFAVDAGTGEVTFNSSPDFESPSDADSNNEYLLEVTAVDGTIESLQIITINVTDLSDSPPVFTSPDQVSISENIYDVLTVEAGDVTYSLIGGADQAYFAIHQNTGELILTQGLDYENPLDDDGNNEYLVEVQADNGQFQSTQMITVTVTDATEEDRLAVGTKDFNVGAPAQNNGFNTLAKSYFQIVYEKEELYAQTIHGISFELHQSGTNIQGLDEWEIYMTENTKEGFSSHVTSQFVTSNLTQVFDGTVVRDGRVVTVYFDQPYEFKGEGNLFIGVNEKSNGSVGGALWSGHYKGLASAGTMASIGVAGSFTTNPASPAGSMVTLGADGFRPYTEFLYAQPPAPQFTSSATSDIDENQCCTFVDVDANDGDGGTVDDGITYSLTGGADLSHFSINASNGQVTFNNNSSADFENPLDQDSDNVYEIEVTADNGFVTATQNISITVNDTNDNMPQFTSPAQVSVNENVTGSIITLEAEDADAGSTLTFSLSGGEDQDDFSLSGAELSFVSMPDFENPVDENGNNVYSIEVSVSDGTNSSVYSMSITVLDVTNEVIPEFTSENTASYVENGTSAALDVNANDGEGGADDEGVSYSISGGVDAALFTIDAASGVLGFNSSPDFENPGDADTNNDYQVEVTADDGTDIAIQQITITVTNANDISPVITSSTTFDIAENETAVQTLTASDADDLGPLTFDITGGSDQFSFELDENTGDLSFITAPDFESPTDAGTDNIYRVNVTVSDGQNETTRTLTITITDVDESPEWVSNASVAVGEGITTVMTLEANDPENQTVTYSINTGFNDTDESFFTLSGDVITFNSAPDFENAQDQDEDNIYRLNVSASDGSNNSSQTIEVAVTDENDNNPVFTSSGTTTAIENTTGVILTVTASDADATSSINYSISGGADMDHFSLDNTSGELTVNAALDFENALDSDQDNIYELEITASDGTNNTTQNLTITITDEDEAPEWVSADNVQVPEGSISVLTVEANDPDAGTSLTFSISGGADQEAFSMESESGELTFIEEPDFEEPGDSDGNNQYEVIVSVSDGLNVSDQTLTVTILDADDTVTGLSNENDPITIYPNPVLNQFKVTTEKTGRVSIFDLNGKFYSSHETNQKIDLSTNKAGVYVLIIAVDERKTIRKILKQ